MQYEIGRGGSLKDDNQAARSLHRVPQIAGEGLTLGSGGKGNGHGL